MQLKNILKLLFWFLLISLLLIYIDQILPLLSKKLNTVILKYFYGTPYDFYRQIRPIVGLLFHFAFLFLLYQIGIVRRSHLEIIEKYSGIWLPRLFPSGLILAFAIAILTWLPHYLYWPWWMDLDHFMVSAQSWENGIRPYRDLIDFNFPGPIYVLWLLGKVFGWGNPMVVNLVDALIVLGLCWILYDWGRARFSSSVPSVFAAFLVIRYYFSLDYARVMQRDWYVVCLAITSICLIQRMKSDWRWLLAALCLSFAMIIRPYAVLMIPPLLIMAVMESRRPDGWHWKPFIYSLTATLSLTLLMWLPLILAGTFDDFLDTFLNALFEGSYKRSDRKGFWTFVFLQFNTKIIFLAFLSLIISLIKYRDDKEKRNQILIWLIASISFLFYAPICPVRHEYTRIPMEIMAAVGCGIGMQLFYHDLKLPAWFRSVMLCFWFTYYFPGWPAYCDANAAVRSTAALVQWQDLGFSPPGCYRTITDKAIVKNSYTWSEYQTLLRYIREETSPETRVVNFLRCHPFPPVNGMTGRLTLWPVGEGILWLHSVTLDLEPDFAERLTGPEPAIVVWIEEGETGTIFPFPLIERTIREHYQPLKKIGQFDIWEKKKRHKSDSSKSRPNQDTVDFRQFALDWSDPFFSENGLSTSAGFVKLCALPYGNSV